MLFDDEFITVSEHAAGEFRDRGSRFLGFIYPVKRESEVKELLQQIKKDHPKANHHCYAFRLGPGKQIFRFSDDREPAGSAGKPIFGVIQSNDLTDVLIIVVRYFGGTLLGVPGLINAYRESAADAVRNASVVTLPVVERYQLNFSYEVMNEVMTVIKMSKAQIYHQELAENCMVQVELIRKNSELFLDKIKNNHLLTGKCEFKIV
ncbi:MAG: YigZ family protein [Bacteroidetes bacterium]|nr:YigZ family protein [Bacteroidota bacterium]